VKRYSPLAFGMALVLGMMTAAMAQYAPGGSYQQSCTHVRVQGNMLSARCSAPSGQRIHSSVPLPCRGDISNSNGYLRCNGGGGGYYPHPGGRPPFGRPPGPGPGMGYLPPGSYQSSCRNAYANGGMLTAECTATNGAWVRTSIEVNRCRPGTDIANVNGRLNCLYYR
jgi:hypothetical protein